MIPMATSKAVTSPTTNMQRWDSRDGLMRAVDHLIDGEVERLMVTLNQMVEINNANPNS